MENGDIIDIMILLCTFWVELEFEQPEHEVVIAH